MHFALRMCFFSIVLMDPMVCGAAEPVGTPEAIVQAWIEASAKRGPFEASGRKLDYDKIFEVVRVAEWKSWVNSPQEWKWSWCADSHWNPDETMTTTAYGVDYRIEPEKEGGCLVHHDAFHSFGGGHSTQFKLTPESDSPWTKWMAKNVYHMRPWSWIAFPHLYPHELADHHIEIASPNDYHGLSDTDVILSLIPKTKYAGAVCQNVSIIFDSTTMLPRAVRIIDSTGIKTTVIMISNLQPVDVAKFEIPLNSQVDFEIPYSHRSAR